MMHSRAAARFTTTVVAALTAMMFPVCAEQGDSSSFSVTKENINLSDGSALIQGTIFRPIFKRQAPGVVILGGSERGPRNPYKERIATFFAQSGLAALIYDSPGTGGSTGNAVLQTKDDRVREAVTVHRFLCNREGVHPKEVGYWGISEGGNIALLAAARDKNAAFAISVSSAWGISPIEVSRYRIEVNGSELGIAQDDIQKALVLEEILYDLLSGAGMAEWRLVRMKTKPWLDEPWDELIGAVVNFREARSLQETQGIQETLRRVLMPWRAKQWFGLAVVDVQRFNQILALDAASFFAFLEKGPWARGDWNDHLATIGRLADLRCPALALWGERDNFLPPHRSAATLKRLLADGNHDLTVEIISDASHVMTHLGSGDFASPFPDIMLDWLKKKLVLPSPRCP